jgi:hypothetical protein
MERLTAIVPATNRPPTLEACLAAVRAAAEPPDEIVVVLEPAGLGPAAARNRGAAQAAGELLVFIDADVAVHPDAFARIRDAFASDPGLAAVFGSYDDDPAERGLVSGFRNLLHHHVHHQGAGLATTFWAGLGAVRKHVFGELGGFDEQRYSSPSIEDVEFGARLHARGGAILLDPLIRGRHLKRWTLASMIRTDMFDRGIPWAELVLTGGADPRALNLGSRHRLSALASVAFVLSLVRRRRWNASISLAALMALNRDFYALVLRRRGPVQASASVLLHVVHHLTGVSAAAVAVGRHVRGRARSARRR